MQTTSGYKELVSIGGVYGRGFTHLWRCPWRHHSTKVDRHDYNTVIRKDFSVVSPFYVVKKEGKQHACCYEASLRFWRHQLVLSQKWYKKGIMVRLAKQYQQIVQTGPLAVKVVIRCVSWASRHTEKPPNYVTLLIFRGNIPREISWHHRLGIKWLTQAVKKQTFKVAHEVSDMCMNKIIIGKD